MNDLEIRELLERIANGVEAKAIRPLLVDVEETCRILGGISQSTLHKRVNTGDVPPSVSVGGRTMWRVKDLEQWAEKLKPSK